MRSTPFRRGFWVILLAALLAAGITASLGFWQLRRAAYKEQIQADIQAREGLEPLRNSALNGRLGTQEWLHRPAQLTGHWVPEATVFLDNRQMNGLQGFYVVTPLRLESDGRWLLVQRGWVQRDFMDRNKVPLVPTPTGLVTVEGRMADAPGKVYQLGEDAGGPIRQNLDLTAFAQEHKALVLNGSLLQRSPLTGVAADGLLRDWPQVASGVQKHLGYAFQWFGLCALIVILYVWFQIIAPLRGKADKR